MKIRKGFVSNSSSSSFVIGIKGAELTPENLLAKLGVPESAPGHEMFLEIAETMVSCAKRSYCNGGKPHTVESLLKDYGYDTVEEAAESGEGAWEIIQLVEAGFTVYSGLAGNEDGGAEAMLCDMEIDIATDDLVVRGGGGY